MLRPNIRAQRVNDKGFKRDSNIESESEMQALILVHIG